MNVVLQHGAVAHRGSTDALLTVPLCDHTSTEVVHVAGFWQSIMGDLLGLRAPRALCGATLIGDPDRPDPAHLGAPVCPRCQGRIRGRRHRRIPAYERRILPAVNRGL